MCEGIFKQICHGGPAPIGDYDDNGFSSGMCHPFRWLVWCLIQHSSYACFDTSQWGGGLRLSCEESVENSGNDPWTTFISRFPQVPSWMRNEPFWMQHEGDRPCLAPLILCVGPPSSVIFLDYLEHSKNRRKSVLVQKQPINPHKDEFVSRRAELL